MSPQGGLVADAKLQGHDRRHGQTREREVEDARAALRHVNVEARRHNRAVRNSPVHRLVLSRELWIQNFGDLYQRSAHFFFFSSKGMLISSPFGPKVK